MAASGSVTLEGAQQLAVNLRSWPGAGIPTDNPLTIEYKTRTMDPLKTPARQKGKTMSRLGIVLVCCLLLSLLSGTGCDKQLTLDLGKGVTMKLVLIPAGTFVMGSREDAKPVFYAGKRMGHYEDERPLHEVRISRAFYMGAFEVSQEQWEAVMGTNPSHEVTGKCPVGNISWNEAMRFCKTLSDRTGRTVRLPTEAEWEYACRAGTTTAFNMGDNLAATAASHAHDWSDDEMGVQGNAPRPVGSYLPNAFGLYNMHGNVWEWCQDWHGSYPNSSVSDPVGVTSGKYKVLRGGAWASPAVWCRSAFRHRGEPHEGYGTFFGFRVVVPAGSGD